jgi:hypothetical protein
MSENTIDSEKISKPVPQSAKPKGARNATNKAEPAKKVTRAKKAAGKPKADRTNKKAEVVALMKRTKGDVGRDSGSHRLAAAHSAGLLVLDSPNRAVPRKTRS